MKIKLEMPVFDINDFVCTYLKNTSGTCYADAYIPSKLLRTPVHKLSFLPDSSHSFRHKLRYSPEFTEPKIYLARENILILKMKN